MNNIAANILRDVRSSLFSLMTASESRDAIVSAMSSGVGGRRTLEEWQEAQMYLKTKVENSLSFVIDAKDGLGKYAAAELKLAYALIERNEFRLADAAIMRVQHAAR